MNTNTHSSKHAFIHTTRHLYNIHTQVAAPERVDAMRNVAKGLGYDTSVLMPVKQEGCKYNGIQN